MTILNNPEIAQIVNNRDISSTVKTSLLRSWVYRNVAYNPTGGEINSYLERKANELSVDDVYRVSTEKGTTCWGFAELLRRMYMGLGYCACIINFGKLDTPFTHAATIVLTSDEHGERVILQDPTFNITFIDNQEVAPSVTDLFKNTFKQKQCPYYRVYDAGIFGKDYTDNPKGLDIWLDYPTIFEDGQYKTALTFEGYNMATLRQAKEKGLFYDDAYFDPVEIVWYFALDAIPSHYRENYFNNIPITEKTVFISTTQERSSYDNIGILIDR
jgi:hypothetical protein